MPFVRLLAPLAHTAVSQDATGSSAAYNGYDNTQQTQWSYGYGNSNGGYANTTGGYANTTGGYANTTGGYGSTGSGYGNSSSMASGRQNW